MIRLQAMMVFPFVVAAFYILMVMGFGLLVFLFNFIHPKLFPEDPKRIRFYWIFMLPIIIIMAFIAIILLNGRHWDT